MTFTYLLRIAELGCRPADREVFSLEDQESFVEEIHPLLGLIGAGHIQKQEETIQGIKDMKSHHYR